MYLTRKERVYGTAVRVEVFTFPGPRLWNELPQRVQKLWDYSKSTLKHIYSNNVVTVK